MDKLNELRAELVASNANGIAFDPRRGEIRRQIEALVNVPRFTDDCILLGFPFCPAMFRYGAAHDHTPTAMPAVAAKGKGK